jgi:hypothetical protein
MKDPVASPVLFSLRVFLAKTHFHSTYEYAGSDTIKENNMLAKS